MDSIIVKARANPLITAVIIVVIIVVLVWFYRASGASDAISEHMTGCWVAPDDFCESAEIGSMMCVFDEPDKTGIGREGYIVILPNGVKSPMHIKYVSCSNKGHYQCTIRANVTFDDGPDWGEDPVSIEIDMLRGAMTIVGERDGVKTVYARLYRQNDISDLVKGIVSAEDAAAISAAP